MGLDMSGIELATFNKVNNLAVYDMATHAATGFCKPSIILFDTRPGTRSFTIPQGVTRIRAFVVGAGGNGLNDGSNLGGSSGAYSEKEYLVTGGDVFSYTVGLAPGGTSSFNSEISATGGGDSGAPAGVASGGDVNFNGAVSLNRGGSSSANRYSAGVPAEGTGGQGWSPGNPGSRGGSSGGIDGFHIGAIPAPEVQYDAATTGQFINGYGCGAPVGQTAFIGGGGGNVGGGGGIGAGGGYGISKGGFGLVGIEVLEVE